MILLEILNSDGTVRSAHVIDQYEHFGDQFDGFFDSYIHRYRITHF